MKMLLRCMGAKCKHLCRHQLENIIIQTSVGTEAVAVACELHVLVPDPRQKGCPAADGVVGNPRRGISWHPAMPPASSVCQRARNMCQQWQDCFSLSVAETGTQPYYNRWLKWVELARRAVTANACVASTGSLVPCLPPTRLPPPALCRDFKINAI